MLNRISQVAKSINQSINPPTWTVTRTTNKGKQIQWIEPGSRRDAKKSVMSLNGYNSYGIFHYQAEPVAKLRKEGFTNDELGLTLPPIVLQTPNKKRFLGLF
jgi:hypothetical protein